MRINEFANAEEQLALWKLISDSVWKAVRSQAEQQARVNAEKALATKVTGSRKPTKAQHKRRGTALAAVAAKVDLQPTAQAQQQLQQQQIQQSQQTSAAQLPKVQNQSTTANAFQANAQPYSLYPQQK